MTKIFADDRALKSVVKNTLQFCSINSKERSIGSASTLTEKQKSKFDYKINKALNFLKI